MTELETRLREAFRARASDISPPVPPLELQARRAPEPVIRGGGNRVWTPVRRRWLIPAGAAIAVLAIVAGALAIAGALPRQQTPPAGPIQTSVPPYYVALMTGSHGSTVATVRATSTSAVIASVRAPHGFTFASLTAATDDRTFVLLAIGKIKNAAPPGTRTYAQRFLVLRIHPAAAQQSARAQLTALASVSIPTDLQVQAMALSPNGQSLAVIFSDPSHVLGTVVPGQLTIFNLADGTQQTWTRKVCADGQCAPGPIGDGAGPLFGQPTIELSWTSSGRSLLFIQGPTGSQVRLLNVGAGGGDVMADSRALPVSTAIQEWNDAVITPNGKSVFIQYSSLAGGVESETLLRFSAATGKATVVNQVPVIVGDQDTGAGPDYLLWTNFDGSKFIVVGARPGAIRGTPNYKPEPLSQTAGIYSGSRYTPISWPTGVVAAAW